MEREELVAQIESYLVVDLQPGYDRTDRLLSLSDDELWESIFENSRLQIPNRAPTPPKQRAAAVAMYRNILQSDQMSRRQDLNKDARKMLVFINQARARRGSTGPLSLAEYREAALWKLLKKKRTGLANLDRHPPKTEQFEVIDRVQRQEIEEVLNILKVLDTDVDLSEDAVKELEDQIKVIQKGSHAEFTKLIDIPAPVLDSIAKNPTEVP